MDRVRKFMEGNADVFRKLVERIQKWFWGDPETQRKPMFGFGGRGLASPMWYTFAWIVSGIIVALLAVAGALNPIARYWRTPGPEDLRPVVAALDSSFREGDRIYVYYGAQPGFAYYHRRHLEAQVDGTENRNAPEAYLAEVESLLDLHSRVWMVFSHCFSKECDFIPDQLATRYSVNLIAVGEGTKLYLAH